MRVHWYSALRFAYAFEIRLVAQVTFAYGDPYVTPSSQGGAGEVSFSDLLNKFSNWQDSATLATTIAAHDSAVVYHIISQCICIVYA